MYFPPRAALASKWMLSPSTSCIVASIARLVFSVEFIQEDPLAGFATNFDSKLPSRHSRISPLTRSSCGRQHHHVVRDRSLHVHPVCQPPLLQSAGGQSRPQPRLLLRRRPLRLLDRRRRLFFSLSLSQSLSIPIVQEEALAGSHLQFGGYQRPCCIRQNGD